MQENQHIKKLLDNNVCLNCMKCTKKNCTSNKYLKNKILYKQLTGENYNK